MKAFSDAGVNVAGHKISWTMVGALAAVAGAFLVWRFHQGGGAIGAGAQSGASNIPATTVSGDITTDPAFENLTQQVSALGAAIPQKATPSTNAGAIALPAALFPQIQSQSAAFENWLVSNQTRPDISGGIATSRWTDLEGEFLRETNQYPKNWK